MDSEKIKKLISENQLEEAIEILLSSSKGTNIQNDIILLSSRYREYTVNKNKGIKSNEELTLLRNIICNDMLALVKIIDDANNFKSLKKNNLISQYKEVLIFKLLIFIVILIDKFIKHDNDNYFVTFISNVFFWSFGVLIGLVFGACIVYGIGFSLIKIPKLNPLAEEGGSRKNYYLFSTSFYIVTYVIDDNLLHTSSIITFYFTCFVIIFLCMGIFVFFISIFDPTIRPSKEPAMTSIVVLLMFSVISFILFMFKHPIMIVLVTKIDSTLRTFFSYF